MPKHSNNALRVCIAVCGGIAAYKVPLLIRALKKKKCLVKVVITNAARPLVGLETLRTLSGNTVYSDSVLSAADIEHISLAQSTDVLCICPATANTIAKLAHGIADNLLTTFALAFEGPVIVAPAMNSAMWLKKITQDNIKTLEKHGMTVLPVEQGELACGTEGPGRMLDINIIAEHILSALTPKTLQGLHILIASGPTMEPIDPVRVITNRSSGKMGSALASQALAMGARVTVVTGPSSAMLPESADCIHVNTAAEMAVELENRFNTADVCIMAAAVSDYRIDNSSDKKLKRGQGPLNLNLIPNPDILANLGKIKKKQILVGFALEDSLDIKRAQEKQKKKNCDIMVLNTVDTALGKDTTEITVLKTGRKPESLGAMDKTEAAKHLLEIIARTAGRINV